MAEIPLDANFNPETVNQVNGPCRAHLYITDVDWEGTRLGKDGNSLIIDFEIVAASDPSQVGLTYRHYFRKAANCGWLIHNFMVAMGAITPERIKELQTAGQNPDYDFDGLIRKQVFGDIVVEVGNDNISRLKILKNGFIALNSKSCSNETRWPRAASYIAKSGVTMPPAFKGEPEKAAAPAAKAAPSASLSKLGKL